MSNVGSVFVIKQFCSQTLSIHNLDRYIVWN